MSEPIPAPDDKPGVEPSSDTPEVKNLQFKAFLLMLFMGALVVGSVVFVLYARGAFEATQRLVLVSDDSEGVVVGMDMTFSGFPIGRVQRIELSAEGNARILIDVPKKDAHWLRESSVFTMVRGLVGGTNIRAYSGVLTDPPLPDGAMRQVLKGDASAEIPKLVSSAKDMIDNLSALTSQSSAFGTSLNNFKALTEKLNGPGGALGVLLGNDQDRKRLMDTLDRTNTLLARLDSVAARADGLAAKADTQVFGPGGLMPESRAAVVQVNAILADTRASLKRVDALLQDAQVVGGKVRDASADLGALRAEVETNLRKVEALVNDINRRWPFASDHGIKLP